MDIGVIIAAGGASTRLGGGSKVLRPLAGKPVLLHSIEFFSRRAEVSAIIVAAAAADMAEIRHICLPWAKVGVVAGGASRTASVANALNAVPAAATHIAVHDAARPLLTARDWQQLLAALTEAPAALLAAPPVDSVKRLDAAGRVAESLPRETLIAAQTPQIFTAPLLRQAYQAAGPDAIATDDASLVERLGAPVKAVMAADVNFKLTYAADFVAAEAVLRLRGES